MYFGKENFYLSDTFHEFGVYKQSAEALRGGADLATLFVRDSGVFAAGIGYIFPFQCNK